MNFNLTNTFYNNSKVLFLFMFESFDIDEVLKDIKIDEKIEILKKRDLFAGKYKEICELDIFEDKGYEKAVLIGLGKKEDLTKDRFIRAYGSGLSSFAYDKHSEIDVFIKEDINFENLLDTISETTIISTYSFNKYKKEDKKSIIESVNVISFRKFIEEDFSKGIISGSYVNMARDLVNEPSNIMYPETLSDFVVDLSKNHDFEVEVFDKNEIKKMGMEAYYSVAKASKKEPKLIVMRYKGNPSSDEILGFIGKGLTYDAGGLSIKSTSGMVTMKSDMGGSAAVISAMCAIAKSGLSVNVTAVIPACENMISGKSYKPGDILKSMNGKTIFIGNTDAEGRLTLADGMTYGIRNEKITRVIDIATLTGAAVRAFAEYVTPVVTNDKEFLAKLKIASNEGNEMIWEMPIVEEYRDTVKHDIADITNIPGTPGMITAGLFMEEFCEDIPWIHIDIAGSSWLDKKKNNFIKGGTGAGTRMLFNLARQFSTIK